MAGVALRQRVGKLFVSVALATALFALGAIPAEAKIFEKGPFVDEYTDAYDNCGFPVAVEGTASGQFRIRQGTGKDATAFFFRTTFSYREVHTNTETGESFVIRGHLVFNEVKATRVEGNVFRFVSVEAGQPFVVEDSAGRVVLRDRGAIRTTILFDTLGDAVPGGVELEVLGVDVRGPHPGFNLSDEEFCALVTSLIGS
jgi:hypothetical protein